jgi:hypothetical protein
MLDSRHLFQISRCLVGLKDRTYTQRMGLLLLAPLGLVLVVIEAALGYFHRVVENSYGLRDRFEELCFGHRLRSLIAETVS